MKRFHLLYLIADAADWMTRQLEIAERYPP